MTTIVVADGNPQALNSALGGTIKRHDDWDVRFATGTTNALERFDEMAHVDVLVANMGSVDGIELLSKVRKRSPKTARVILSGETESQDVWRSIGAAHHYLTDPVNVKEFERIITVARNCSTTELRDPIRTMITKVDRLPSPPALFLHIVDMLKSERWTVDDLANLLSSDVALTAEILKLVNSAYFGASSTISSVSQAVTLLGVDMIRTLVLANKLFQPHDDLKSWLDLDHLDRRCRAVASGAHALALRDNASPDVAQMTFLAGMVNEVGLLVMARVPQIGVSMATPLNNRVFLDVEQALFGGDRFVVGSHLLKLWGFHPDIIEGILQVKRPDVVDATGLPWYLYAARQLVLEHGFNPLDLAAPPGPNPAIDRALGAARLPADASRT